MQLPSPSTVAPNQPYTNKSVYKYWLLFVLLALFIGFIALFKGSGATVFDKTYRLDPAPAPTPNTLQLPGGTNITLPGAPATAEGQERTQMIFTEPFQLKGGENIRVSGQANVSNNWLYVAGDLINEETGLVQQFDLPMESYAGVEDGESWSEGNPNKTEIISALPAGTYTMRSKRSGRSGASPRRHSFPSRSSRASWAASTSCFCSSRSMSSRSLSPSATSASSGGVGPTALSTHLVRAAMTTTSKRPSPMND